MGNKAPATEHSGAKHGRGAYYGPKAAAKRDSKKKRRAIDKEIIKNELSSHAIRNNDHA